MNLRISKLIKLGTALGLLAIFNLAAGDQGGGSLAQVECTLTLQPGQSIQKAIDQAKEGAVICLAKGTWEENLNIEKKLTLRGAGPAKTIVKGAKEGYPVVRIESDSEIEVVLEGLTITEAWGKCAEWRRICPYGILVGGKARVTVQDSTISGNEDAGLSVRDSAHVSLNNSTVSENGYNGLRVRDSANVRLNNSMVSGNRWNGLFVGDSAEVELNDNVIKDNRGYGIWVASKEARVSGTNNTMSGNGADLCGFAPAALRKPLVPQTERTELIVPTDFKSIQEAVDAIAPGGTITVAAGIYEEGLTIWKPLRLVGVGRGQTIIKALPERGLIVSIIAEAQDVVLEGLTVTESKGYGLWIYGGIELQNIEVSGNGGNGLWVWGSANVNLVNSTILENWRGLDVRDSAQVTLNNSTISGNRWGGLWVDDSAQATLDNSTVSGNRWAGLFVVGSAKVTMNNSMISGNDYVGLAVTDSAEVTLNNSTISGNRWHGLDVGDSARVSLVNSTVSGNGENGLSVWRKSPQVSLNNSTVSGNRRHGLYVGSSAKVTINGSTIEKNGANGILVSGDSQTTISDSIIKNNTDWGLAAYLKKCGYTYDDFAGRVTITRTQIYGNGKGNVCR